MKIYQTPLLLALLATGSRAFNYDIIGAGAIALTDVTTQIAPIFTLFLDEAVEVNLEGLEWNYTGNEGGSDLIFYSTLVDGKEEASGNISLANTNRELPTSITAGTITVTDKGRHTIEVVLTLDGVMATTSSEYEAMRAGTSIIPLIIVMLLAVTTHMVEFSLFTAIFVGACMVTGDVNMGFKTMLDDYILNALSDVSHGYVYLFTLFLSGFVGMMERSGGMYGFTKDIAKYATSSRTGQLVTFATGCFIFFDDYANVLLAGETMRPLTDVLNVSREKLSFIVDATAAPVASLSPVSSWVGFEVGLIQEQIDRMLELNDGNITIDTSGLGVFLQSIKYRYYPIFMVFMIPVLIIMQRDFGPMLVAERKTQVYARTDGGDGSLHAKSDSEHGGKKQNAPRDDQPLKSWNMILPVFLLIFFIFYMLVKTGEIEGESQSIIGKLQESDSFASLLWGTMAGAITTFIFYSIQIVQHGEVVIPTWQVIKGLFVFSGGDEELGESNSSSRPRLLMNMYDNVESFLYGMSRIFPALIVLTLAWATGSVMTRVGVDRLVSRWIVGGISASSLPTLSFIISALMALATGTSWGTMAIIFPLITVPTYEASGGDPQLFYATVAGVLSGAVAGDHISPISDTTVLSALACDCQLLAHVSTQAPYGLFVSIISILFGTLPIGRETWPNIVGILLGALVIVVFAFLYAKPVVDKDGKFDFFTELVMKFKGSDSEMEKLRLDTIAYCEKGGLVGKAEEDIKQPHEDVDDDKLEGGSSSEDPDDQDEGDEEFQRA